MGSADTAFFFLNQNRIRGNLSNLTLAVTFTDYTLKKNKANMHTTFSNSFSGAKKKKKDTGDQQVLLKKHLLLKEEKKGRERTREGERARERDG